MILLRVRHRGDQNLMQRLSALSGVISEKADRVQGVLTANFVRDNAHLSGLHSYIFCDCSYFHRSVASSGDREPSRKAAYFTRRGLSKFRPPLGEATCVTTERAGRSKFSEFVTNHVLRNEDRNVLSTVVDGKSVSDHVGGDRRSTAPSLNEPLLATIVQVKDLLHKVVIDKKSFL